MRGAAATIAAEANEADVVDAQWLVGRIRGDAILQRAMEAVDSEFVARELALRAERALRSTKAGR